MPHPDLEVERARLRFADECLEGMRRRTQEYVALEDLAANEADSEAVRYQLEQRLKSLAADGRALTFGRIDSAVEGGEGSARLHSARGSSTERASEYSADSAGERYYIGRRHVEDDAGEPVVVDWRAPVSIPFYRATAIDALGLVLRRRFTFTLDDLADIYEEDFNDPDSLLDGGAAGVPDPLLAELRRERTGQMRDIVATIQSEQDEVIRAPLRECLVVQGGPGTGKTAVGLHRAAFLLFEHREQLLRQGVLVVGPNRVFLEYIAQVLPSLGETSVSQATVDGLLGLRFRLSGTDSVDAARVKGDGRMAIVIRRAAERAIAIPNVGIAVTYRGRVLRVAPPRLAELVDAARTRDMPLAEQRLRFRELVDRDLYDDFTRGELIGRALEDFREELRADRDAQKQVDKLWKPVNPTAIVQQLLTSKTALARAADGVLDENEQAAVLRPKPKRGAAEPWTRADHALLDETEAFVKGGTRQYGHLVVDEAQDLSPMELRMVGRRAMRGSMTVLGDLAQATSPAASTSWDESIAHLGASEVTRFAELTIGYRLPAAILEFANHLLAVAAPHVTPARSAREEGDPPTLVPCRPDELVDRVVERVRIHSAVHTTTAVIADEEQHGGLREALLRAGVEVGLDPHATNRVSLLDPALAKGLEFDAVVVLEPAAIVAGSDQGVRLLFVALTRAVAQLDIVHSQALPAALRGGERRSAR